MLFWVNTLWHLQWLTILDIILLQAVFAIEYCSKPKPISRISKSKIWKFCSHRRLYVYNYYHTLHEHNFTDNVKTIWEWSCKLTALEICAAMLLS